MELDLDGTEGSMSTILESAVDALKDGVKGWSAEELDRIIEGMSKALSIKISN